METAIFSQWQWQWEGMAMGRNGGHHASLMANPEDLLN